MAVELIYKHQQKTYDLMRGSLGPGKREVFIYPVGCGKTFPPIKYLEDCLKNEQNKKFLYVTSGLDIIDQTKSYISEYILGGKPVNKKTLPNFRAVTYHAVGLLKSIKKLRPDVIIFDEIHRMGAEHWEECIEELLKLNPNAEIIGMSATPERTDKRNMAYEKFGGNIIYEMTLTEALSGEKEGEVVLNGSRYFKILSELKDKLEPIKRQIDLVDDEKRQERLIKKFNKLTSIISESPEISDVMEQAMKKKNGKYVVFCRDREDMYQKMEEAQSIFGKVNNNISIDYVISKENGDGKTRAENRRTIKEFEIKENGDSLNLLFCVDMLNEGKHIKGLDGEVQFAPTNSKIRYKQIIGRVLTSDKNAGETVIIDAVNNWIRQIDTYRELEHAIQISGKKNAYDLFKISGEETELLDVLREIQEDLGYKSKDTYKDIIEWLDTHDGKLPRRVIFQNGKPIITKDLTEEERYEVRLRARWNSSFEKSILDKCIGMPTDELPEGYREYKEQIDKLRSYGLGLEEKPIYDQIIEWLDTHDEKLPQYTVYKDGKRLKMNDLSEEKQKENRLNDRWHRSPEYKALTACIGISIEELPDKYKKYRNQIEELRSYGLGLPKKSTYEQMIEWLDAHDGKLPQHEKRKDGNKLNIEDLTKQEKLEIRLRKRWDSSSIKEALDACIGIPIDELPEEYKEYKDQIEKLRSYGLGNEEKATYNTYEEIIEWLKSNENNIPNSAIYKDGKLLKRDEMTEQELYEVRLRARWNSSSIKEALEACIGIPIDELPEEYKEYKDQIEELRSYGLGLKEKPVYDQIIEWLGTHNSNLPRKDIKNKGKSIPVDQLSKEEKYEVRLRGKWKSLPERKALEACIGIPIDELPDKYKKYKNQIEELRSYGLGLPEKTTYEKIVDWLKTHNSTLPRIGIFEKGRKLSRKQLSEEELYEVRLRSSWEKTKEKEAVEACRGLDLDKIPEEYAEYKEQIATIRKFEEMAIGNAMDKKFKSSVRKHVGENSETRAEINNIKVRKTELTNS